MTVDSLESAGLTRMDEDAIEAFLESQRVGVLGLPAEDAPYMVPISYGYDGEALYFTFVGGPDSRKRQLVDRAETAGFLVYDVRSMFNWESVVLTGRPEAVPESELADLETVLEGAWRPEVFERAIASDDIVVYRFRIEDRDGIKHTGLPPGFGEA
ncbi:pyridoxamine 5'-phosphate oxidase family protein [Halomicroarcula sp. GCM10025709]|uniref:pyridoxamine 5'-phosphate oxidase family protein n=1 Tax=Haloarcula TaxID=2237 RepID=UPI0024C27A43|nr:pyridoxamine 5'-phosphate oxidase family protein [Halomicroarcula sp. YJ-61-S]